MQRINARLDQTRSLKLQHLKNQMRLSTTEVLLSAIDALYEHETSSSKLKRDSLLNSDFIACGEAEYDLSSNHKEYLHQAMNKKYDNR